MAKTSPAEFINQVRAEARKIVWPTGRETVQTTIMVIIMMTILSLFSFFGVDTVFNAIVSWLRRSRAKRRDYRDGIVRLMAPGTSFTPFGF